jgi:ABC-type multidrug transport system ATPase subunit
MQEAKENLKGEPMQATQETGAVIAVEQLVKRYRRAQHNAVDGLSFQVRRGEIFGLLGPNGAGKTTVIGTLTTSVLPTSGQVTLAGLDVIANPIGTKQRVAVVPLIPGSHSARSSGFRSSHCSTHSPMLLRG